MLKKTKRNQDGFSLLEMTIAGAILAIAITSGFSAHISSTMMERHADQTTTVMNEIRAQIEDIKGTPFNDIYLEFNDTTFEIVGLTGPEVEILGQGMVVVPPGNISVLSVYDPTVIETNPTPPGDPQVVDYDCVEVRIVVTWEINKNETETSTFRFRFERESGEVQ